MSDAGPERDDPVDGPDMNEDDEPEIGELEGESDGDAGRLSPPSERRSPSKDGPRPKTEDDDDFLILDPNHPMVRRQQTALNKQLIKLLEILNMALKEELALEKVDTINDEEMGAEKFRIQKLLDRSKNRLVHYHQNKVQAELNRRDVQEALETMKDSVLTGQVMSARENESKLRKEMENLTLQLLSTQQTSDALQSNVKVLKNKNNKENVEKAQAEDQKQKQDRYVNGLIKEMERLNEQIALYEALTIDKNRETRSAKEALLETKIDLESLAMERKQLMQQWNNTLVHMRKQDEAFSALLETLSTVEQQLSLQDREQEGLRKLITQEQELNESQTLQLKLAQLHCATASRAIMQKQMELRALQTTFSTYVRSTRETEKTLKRLNKEGSMYQSELVDQRKQLERANAKRLELENKIMNHMQQNLTHSMAAKYSKLLIDKIVSMKEDTNFQLKQLEKDIEAVGMDAAELSQTLQSLTMTLKTLDDEVSRCLNTVSANDSKMFSCMTLIEQKQTTITNLNRKIGEIVARTGVEDLSPLQIKVEAILAQIKEVTDIIENDNLVWTKRQETLVGLMRELQMNSKEMHTRQTQFSVRNQKIFSLESQVKMEQVEDQELSSSTKMLQGDLLKLNCLLNKNGERSMALEQGNALMESDIVHKLKVEERETIEIQMRKERTQEEKESLLGSLLEAEPQVVLWEKKTELVKETLNVGSEVQTEIQMMKTEIHRMEVHLSQLTKHQEYLLSKSEETASKWGSLIERNVSMMRISQKQMTSARQTLVLSSMKRKLQETHKDIDNFGTAVSELQKSHVSMNNRLDLRRQQLKELQAACDALQQSFSDLQDTKDRNLAQLVTLQGWNKRLQSVSAGKYKASSARDAVDQALQSQNGKVGSTSLLLTHVLKEFPQHQEVLRKPTQMLKGCSQALELEPC
ncbi:coiled-coil domain-containing protein 40-like isoform 1-T1 [Synchiropus picturatus]